MAPVDSRADAGARRRLAGLRRHRRRGHSELSRFWELEAETDCGTFGLRGYGATGMSVVTANNVNAQPTSGNPANNVETAQPYSVTETRLQLSVRTKLAQGLLTRANPLVRDSLWFGYTQQSYWQLFNGNISRPFRTTDMATACSITTTGAPC